MKLTINAEGRAVPLGTAGARPIILPAPRRGAPRKGWDAALEAMQEIDQSLRTDDGLAYMEKFVISHGEKIWNRQTGSYGDRTGDGSVQIKHTEGLGIAAVAALRQGDPIWVAEEVVDLIDVAVDAPTFKPQPVFLDDPMVPTGFVLLERPLSMIDAKGKEMRWRAMSWAPVTGQSPDGKQLGELGLAIALWAHGEDGSEYDLEYEEQTGMKLMVGGSLFSLVHLGLVEWGHDYTGEWEGVGGTPDRMLSALDVLWRLAKQELALPRLEKVQRQTWRGLKRQGWREIKHVTVMKLRRSRPANYEGEGRETEWSHRWLVSGHWRNQPYKIDGKIVHRQIWISPYIKGPEDRPFVAKVRGIEFTR